MLCVYVMCVSFLSQLRCVLANSDPVSCRGVGVVRWINKIAVARLVSCRKEKSNEKENEGGGEEQKGFVVSL